MPPPSRDSAAPAPDETGQHVLELRQLDLPLAFARARAPGKNVQDQLRPIDDLALQLLLELPQLSRRQLVVEDDDVDVRVRTGGGERRRPCRRR